MQHRVLGGRITKVLEEWAAAFGWRVQSSGIKKSVFEKERKGKWLAGFLGLLIYKVSCNKRSMYDWGSRVDPLYTFTYHVAYVFLHSINYWDGNICTIEEMQNKLMKCIPYFAPRCPGIEE